MAQSGRDFSNRFIDDKMDPCWKTKEECPGRMSRSWEGSRQARVEGSGPGQHRRAGERIRKVPQQCAGLSM